MIGKLKGIIDEIKPTELILDINGVGYLVYIPFSTYNLINKSTGTVSLFITTYVREDLIKLFGFFTKEEKNFFEILLKVSGIGPSVALSILSGLPVDELIGAVEDQNSSKLVKIPGIGKSKAEKILFELKRKLKNLKIDKNEGNGQPDICLEAIEALLTLGFDQKKVEPVIDEKFLSNKDISLEDLIKESLVVLSK